MLTTASQDYILHRASARPKTATAAAANEPTVLVAAPVNGALPGPLGEVGVIGEPVAPGPDPAPPEGEPAPVGAGAAVPVANPVEPATPDELHSRVSIEIKLRAFICSPNSCGLGA